MFENFSKVKWAILCLTALEITAMVTGNNGAYLLPVAAIIGGLGGYELREKKDLVDRNLKRLKEIVG